MGTIFNGTNTFILFNSNLFDEDTKSLDTTYVCGVRPREQTYQVSISETKTFNLSILRPSQQGCKKKGIAVPAVLRMV